MSPEGKPNQSEELFTVPHDLTTTDADGNEVQLKAGQQITVDEARAYGLAPALAEPAAEAPAEAEEAKPESRAKGAAPENRSR